MRACTGGTAPCNRHAPTFAESRSWLARSICVTPCNRGEVHFCYGAHVIMFLMFNVYPQWNKILTIIISCKTITSYIKSCIHNINLLPRLKQGNNKGTQYLQILSAGVRNNPRCCLLQRNGIVVPRKTYCQKEKTFVKWRTEAIGIRLHGLHSLI